MIYQPCSVTIELDHYTEFIYSNYNHNCPCCADIYGLTISKKCIKFSNMNFTYRLTTSYMEFIVDDIEEICKSLYKYSDHYIHFVIYIENTEIESYKSVFDCRFNIHTRKDGTKFLEPYRFNTSQYSIRKKIDHLFDVLQNTNQINPATSIKCKFVAV